MTRLASAKQRDVFQPINVALAILILAPRPAAADDVWPALPERNAAVEIPAQEWPHKPEPRRVKLLLHFPGGKLANVNSQSGVMLTLHNWGGQDCVGTANPDVLANRLNVVAVCVNYLQSGRQASLEDPEPYDFGYLQALDALRAVWFVSDGLAKANCPFDAGRIFCTGGSGGGNVTLMANKLAPRTFACVVDMCGMKKLTHDVAFNLPGSSELDARWSRDPSRSNFLSADDQEIRFVGHPDHLAAMKRLGASTKIVVVHGVDDSACSFADAQEMVANMREAGMDVEPRFITKHDVDGTVFTSSGHALGNRTEIVFRVAEGHLSPESPRAIRRGGPNDFERGDEVSYRTSSGQYVISYRDGFPVGRFEADPPPVSYDEHQDLTYYRDRDGGRHDVTAIDAWQVRRQHVLDNMQLVMGRLPGATMRVPLDVRVLAEKREADLLWRKLSYQSDPTDRVAAWLLIPDRATDGQSGTNDAGRRAPAVLCLHQTTSGGKDEPVGLSGSRNMRYALELARRGYVILAPDYPSLGEHAYDFSTQHDVVPEARPARPTASLDFASGTMKAIWDNIRAVDLLASLPEVDGERIGVIGHSLGGHNAMFTAAFDPRLKAIVSSCGFTRFHKDDVPSWTGPRYMPRIASVYGNDPNRMPFDFTEIVGTFAPRPFLACAATGDDDFDVSGVRDVIQAAKSVYTLYGQPQHLQAVYPEAPHDFPADARNTAYAFLDQHLRGPVAQQPTQKESRVSDVSGTPALHLPLAGDGRDVSGNGLHAALHGVNFDAAGPSGQPRSAAAFNGRDAWLEVPADKKLQIGRGDFAVSAWVQTDSDPDDVPGDILSQYDPARRRGWHLTLKTNAGVTFSQANAQQLQFGIDNDVATAEWIDCGRPGNALLAFALCVHAGDLYAGTCEPGKDEAGHVYRYAAPGQWVDSGSPDRSNSVTAMAVYGGKLYAGTGKYRVAGSSLPESENLTLGGRVFRYEGGTRWTDCGQLPNAEAVAGMVVFAGRLYASSLYKPAGFFRYEANQEWTDCGVPNGMRVEALGVYNGFLYATSYDGGRVFRFDGRTWTDCGQLGDAGTNTQTYAFAVLEGRLHVGTWRSGRVFRFEDVDRWTDVGRLGEELEVMGMLVHNGRLLAGTLPLAEVYSFEGGDTWKRLTQLDATPDVRYRRAWTMCEFQGRVFCSTLPSGRVFSFEAGKSVTWDYAFPDGWHHVAAVKSAGKLSLFVDGKQVAQSGPFAPDDFDLTSDRPLRVGFGSNDYFRGRLAHVRLDPRALTAAEIRVMGESK